MTVVQSSLDLDEPPIDDDEARWMMRDGRRSSSGCRPFPFAYQHQRGRGTRFLDLAATVLSGQLRPMLSCRRKGARHVADVRHPDLSQSQGRRHASTIMRTNLRYRRLESAGLAFGVEGKLALAEYYASLADPADFRWSVAVAHIGNRLQLPNANMCRLAIAVASEQIRRRHMTAFTKPSQRGFPST
jgi:hypothetical protein